MLAKKFQCHLVNTQWLTPTVMGIRFEPSKRFAFQAGQFLSLIVPGGENDPNVVKRAYSLSSAPDGENYELCVRYVPGGRGSEYLKSLRSGDPFSVFAPYGHFTYQPKPGNNVCFISTGSGIAPFRSMVLSREFMEQRPERVWMLMGARTEDEVIFPGFFEHLGIETVRAISQPSPKWSGFHGRITNWLRSLDADFPWHTTDFYICGNADMALEVRKILSGRGVPETNVHLELFFLKKDAVNAFASHKEADVLLKKVA